MQFARCLAIALAGVLFAPVAGDAQSRAMNVAPATVPTPYFVNVSFGEAVTKAVLVNPRAVALVAWSLDVVDAGGRSVGGLMSDSIELPAEAVPARGQKAIDIPGRSPIAAAVIFRAGIDANGLGIGDAEMVGRLREWRARTARSRSIGVRR